MIFFLNIIESKLKTFVSILVKTAYLNSLLSSS